MIFDFGIVTVRMDLQRAREPAASPPSSKERCSTAFNVAKKSFNVGSSLSILRPE